MNPLACPRCSHGEKYHINSIVRCHVIKADGSICQCCGEGCKPDIDEDEITYDPDILEIFGLTEEKIKAHPSRDQCSIDECFTCAIRDCPDNEPLHYDKDGCPACVPCDENCKICQEKS